MSNLKKDNWTNDEIIKLISGRKIHDREVSKEQSKFTEDWNFVVDEIVELFRELKSDQFAYDTDKNQIVYTGPTLPRDNYQGPHYAPHPKIKENE